VPPAAKQGDKVLAVDIHIIMIPTPGGPVPTPLPHPFNGTLLQALSTDVTIEGMPAATVDSIAMCTPPHIPQGGPFQKPPSMQGKVFMGSATVFIDGKPAARMGDICMTCNDPTDLPVGQIVSTTATVFIEGPPSKAGSKAGGSAEGSQKGGSGGTGKAEAAAQEKKDFIEFVVRNAKGQPAAGEEYELLLPDGTIKTGKLGGDGKLRAENQPHGVGRLRLKGLHAAHWSVPVAGVDQQIEAVVDTACIADGAAVKLEVFREFEEAPQDALKTLTGKVAKGRASAAWTYAYDRKDEGRRPRFVFHASAGDYRAVSDPLVVGDILDVTLKDPDGHAVPGVPYTIFGFDGEERDGTADPAGKIKAVGLAFSTCVLRLRAGTTIRRDSGKDLPARERLHVVKEGEWLASIARAYGFRGAEDVYDHPLNETLRRLRPDPNVVCAGDEVWIPPCPYEVELKMKSQGDGPTTLKVEVPRKEKLDLVLQDGDGQPLRNTPYTLKIGGFTKPGQTDGSGKLHEEFDAQLLRFGVYSLIIEGHELRLQIGHLDPIDTMRGVQQRLNNLGYDAGPVDGVAGERTRTALARFQADQGLEATGAADEDTRKKLDQVHGTA
jgi:uncharacterized Zn-binding protein involved in type VI secretion